MSPCATPFPSPPLAGGDVALRQRGGSVEQPHNASDHVPRCSRPPLSLRQLPPQGGERGNGSRSPLPPLRGEMSPCDRGGGSVAKPPNARYHVSRRSRPPLCLRHLPPQGGERGTEGTASPPARGGEGERGIGNSSRKGGSENRGKGIPSPPCTDDHPRPPTSPEPNDGAQPKQSPPSGSTSADVNSRATASDDNSPLAHTSPTSSACKAASSSSSTAHNTWTTPNTINAETNTSNHKASTSFASPTTKSSPTWKPSSKPSSTPSNNSPLSPPCGGGRCRSPFPAPPLAGGAAEG